jgi:hypothetical protein
MTITGTNLSPPEKTLLTTAPSGSHLKITLQRSGGMYESGVVGEDVPEESVYYLPTPDGPWVQLTYEYVRSQDGEFPLAYSDGYWYGADEHPASDILIEFVTN